MKISVTDFDILLLEHMAAKSAQPASARPVLILYSSSHISFLYFNFLCKALKEIGWKFKPKLPFHQTRQHLHKTVQYTSVKLSMSYIKKIYCSTWMTDTWIPREYPFPLWLCPTHWGILKMMQKLYTAKTSAHTMHANNLSVEYHEECELCLLPWLIICLSTYH
jgi:hypothetical protein